MQGGREEEMVIGVSKIVVFGGTGYLGGHIVRASVSLGHPTYVYTRPLNTNSSSSKMELLKEFELMGVTIIQGELYEHEKLVSIMKQIDIVISSISSPHVIEQLKIIDAIKTAGNIKRFIPSDFGCDEDRVRGLPPFQALLDKKKEIRRATEAAKIRYTYISSFCIGNYFLNFLFHPPHGDSDKELIIYGSGATNAVFTCEKDVGLYTIKVATDQRTENRSVIFRPPKNVASQLDVTCMWETKTGHSYKKHHVSDEDLVKFSETLSHPKNIQAAILHGIFVDGDTNIELKDDDMEVTKLYPDFTYKTLENLIDGILANPSKFAYIAL